MVTTDKAALWTDGRYFLQVLTHAVQKASLIAISGSLTQSTQCMIDDALVQVHVCMPVMHLFQLTTPRSDLSSLANLQMSAPTLRAEQTCASLQDCRAQSGV